MAGSMLVAAVSACIGSFFVSLVKKHTNPIRKPNKSSISKIMKTTVEDVLSSSSESAGEMLPASRAAACFQAGLSADKVGNTVGGRVNTVGEGVKGVLSCVGAKVTVGTGVVIVGGGVCCVHGCFPVGDSAYTPNGESLYAGESMMSGKGCPSR